MPKLVFIRVSSVESVNLCAKNLKNERLHFRKVENYANFVQSFSMILLRSIKIYYFTKNRYLPCTGLPAVYLKGHVYLLDCLYKSYGNFTKIEKYSVAADTVEVVGDMFEDRRSFCVCGFIDKIYFIGGHCRQGETAACRYFDTINRTWEDAASMKEGRSSAACTAFEGRIVVSGGFNNGALNTVETYDHIADEWSRMPSMTKGMHGHFLVAAKNKLFAVENRNFEVYDSSCKKFVSILSKVCKNTPLSSVCGAVSVENKILVFYTNRSKYSCYNVDKEEWTTESCMATSDRENKFTVIPKLKLY